MRVCLDAGLFLCRQLKNRADHSNDEADRLHAQGLYDSYNAATYLTKQKVGNSSVPYCEIKKQAEIIKVNGYSFPGPIQVLICKRYSQQLAFEGKLDLWADSCRPTGNSGDDDDWSIDEPHWRCIPYDLAADSDDFAKYAEAWPASVLNDAILRSLSEEGCPVLIEHMLKFLSRVDASSFASAPEHYQVVFGGVVKVAKGLVGLASPVPGKGNCTLGDIQYAMPSNGTSAAVYKDLPKIGRLIASRLRADPFFKKQFED